MRKQGRYRLVLMLALMLCGVFLWAYWNHRRSWSPVNPRLKTGLVISRVANLQIDPAITFPDRSYVRGVTIHYTAVEREWGISYTVLTEAKKEDIVRYYKQQYNRYPVKWLTDDTNPTSDKEIRFGFIVFKDSSKREHVFTIVAGPILSGDAYEFDLSTQERKRCSSISVYITMPLLGEIQRRGGYLPIVIP